MRILKIVVIAGLILAVTGAASAVTVPSLPAGPLKLKYSNWDMGVTYSPGQGPDDGGAAAIDLLTQTIFPGVSGGGGTYEKYWDTSGTAFYLKGADTKWYDNAALTVLHGGTGAKPANLEDAWLVFRVKEITDNWFNGNTLYAWDTNTSVTEIVGMAYGLEDVAVGSAGSILSDGYTIELWAQAAGNFDYLPGSSGRTDFDKYTGVGSPGGVGDSVLLWKATTSPDPNFGTPPGEIFDTGAPGIPTFSHIAASTGRSDMYLVSVSGLWADGNVNNGEVVPSTFLDLYSGGLSVTKDGHIKSSVSFYIPETASADWLFFSEDPLIVSYVVPEPLTMLTVFGAVGCVGAYVRKRRNG